MGGMGRMYAKFLGLCSAKVRGFTIMEALIGLALTGLVSLLVFAGIRYYHRLFSTILLTGHTQTEINLLQQAIENDFAKAKEVFYEDGIKCSSATGAVAYRFVEEGIVRLDSFEPDTFKLKHQPVEFSMVPGQDRLINLVSIVCYNGDLQFVVSGIKEYPVGIIIE